MRDFEQVLRLLKEYRKTYGDCVVERSYTTEEGIPLGIIVHSIRSGIRKTSTEEKAMLNNLGFVWKVNQSPVPFDQVIILLGEYKKRHGDCLVPRSYTTKEGIHLGKIVNCIRTGDRRTNIEEKEMLNKLGFVWKVYNTHKSIEQVVRLLKEYKEKYGDCLVPHSYITEEGICLGEIVHNIRYGQRKTSIEEKEMLDSIGFVWKLRERRID